MGWRSAVAGSPAYSTGAAINSASRNVIFINRREAIGSFLRQIRPRIRPPPRRPFHLVDVFQRYPGGVTVSKADVDGAPVPGNQHAPIVVGAPLRRLRARQIWRRLRLARGT